MFCYHLLPLRVSFVQYLLLFFMRALMIHYKKFPKIPEQHSL
jgi:hypothetical protein